MSNLNKVMLIGRVGQDPEVRYTKGGQAVADLRMATNEFWKDKQGNRQERTEWHSVVFWGGQAEFVQNYVKKGRLIYIEGRLQTRDWTDNQNVKHYKTEIVANTVQLLDRQGDAAGQGGGYAGGQRAQGGSQGGGQRGNRGSPPQGGADEEYGPRGGSSEPEEAYIEDDIPF